MFAQPCTQAAKFLCSCKALKSIIKRYFAWIYKSQCRSSSNSIYLCFPFLGLSQCHFTSDVAESTVLNGQGYRYWKYGHFCYQCYGFATDFHSQWQWQKKNQTPSPCHFYDRAWLRFEGIHSLEKGSFIRETSSLTQRPRRKVQTRGPFGPT